MAGDIVQISVDRIQSKAVKRSGWVSGVVVIQALWMLALVALPIYLLFLARSSGILHGAEGKETANGLRIGAEVTAVPALFAIVSWYGLWKKTLWGWWVALFSNTLVFGVLIYAMTDENTIDWDMVGVTAVSAALPILLLLPMVRKFYWHVTESR
jgi:hypothetical protein